MEVSSGGYEQIATRHRTFQRQQELLCRQSAAEARQRAVGAEQAVAGQHDRDRVASVRRAHREHRLRLADAAGDVAVGPGLRSEETTSEIQSRMRISYHDI